LSATFEIESPAAISKISVIGNVIVSAIVASKVIIISLSIHKLFIYQWTAVGIALEVLAWNYKLCE
jgi:hypothetical protein